MLARFGLVFMVCLSAAVTGLLVAAVVSPSWFTVTCGDRGLKVGLWSACEESDPGGKTDDHCQDVDSVLVMGSLPGWLSGGRLLATSGAAAAGVTCLLLVGYCFVPVPAAMDSAHGLGFAGICTAAFCFINLLNAYVGRYELGGLLDPAICHQPNSTALPLPTQVVFSRGFHLTLAGALVALLGGLGGVTARLVVGPAMLAAGGVGDGGPDGKEDGQEGRKLSRKRQMSRKVLTKIRMKNKRGRRDT